MIESLQSIWETALSFLSSNAELLGAATAVLAGIEWLFSPFRSLARKWRKPEIVELGAETKKALAGDQANTPKLTVPDFIRIRRELKDDLMKELARAEVDEKDQLRARITELETQIANPEKSLAEAQTRIADLEQLLERSGNEIGGDRIAAARGALERGDYSIADDLFAEIEARQGMAVQEAARAAFGRGEIAEAEVRWVDAAAHYEKAARLDPSYETLIKAGDFLMRAGDHISAIRYQDELAELARRDHGPSDAKTATALNNLAESYRAAGRYGDAEPLYREALKIGRKIFGTEHPDYALRLSNLSVLLKATGRFEEAEPLSREAFEITRRTLGVEDPEYAIRLNNLAVLLMEMSRFEEAEPLCREALDITRTFLGTEHPDYALRLNNLAGLLHATDRFEEAEPLYREALEITRKALGTEHPDYRLRLNHLAEALQAKGRFEEAEALYRGR